MKQCQTRAIHTSAAKVALYTLVVSMFDNQSITHLFDNRAWCYVYLSVELYLNIHIDIYIFEVISKF